MLIKDKTETSFGSKACIKVSTPGKKIKKNNLGYSCYELGADFNVSFILIAMKLFICFTVRSPVFESLTTSIS